MCGGDNWRASCGGGALHRGCCGACNGDAACCASLCGCCNAGKSCTAIRCAVGWAESQTGTAACINTNLYAAGVGNSICAECLKTYLVGLASCNSKALINSVKATDSTIIPLPYALWATATAPHTRSGRIGAVLIYNAPVSRCFYVLCAAVGSDSDSATILHVAIKHQIGAVSQQVYLHIAKTPIGRILSKCKQHKITAALCGSETICIGAVCTRRITALNGSNITCWQVLSLSGQYKQRADK